MTSPSLTHYHDYHHLLCAETNDLTFMSAARESAKFSTNGRFGFAIFPFQSQGTHAALAWLLHPINTACCQVTVHCDIAIKYLIIYANELLTVVVKRIIVIFIPHCDVTNISV
jgi:hypothetical protein